jgi:hypothetical protein
MSTVAVLKAHTHERVSFGACSGKTLVPEDIIQVDAFISQTWLYEPPLRILVDQGNSRKNPLDNSLTSGSSIFVQNSPEGYKVGETLDVCAFPSYDPDGSQEVATKKEKVGPTNEFRISQVVNGEIPSGATPNRTATATPTIDTVTVTHPSPSVVVATIEMKISNPLLLPTSLAFPIHYQTTVTIDRSNPSQPTCTVTGTNSEFPAYEIYINQQQVYHFDPVPSGYGPWDLKNFDQTYNTPNIPLTP